MKISVILYKSKTLSDGSHPLMIRISELKARKYLSTGFSCPADLWDFQKNTPKGAILSDITRSRLAQKKSAYHTKLLELESEQKTLSLQQLVQQAKSPSKLHRVYFLIREL